MIAPYTDYQKKMGVSEHERVPPRDSMRHFVAEEGMKQMLEAATKGEAYTLEGDQLLHVLNILLPLMLAEARTVGWTWDEIKGQA